MAVAGAVVAQMPRLRASGVTQLLVVCGVCLSVTLGSSGSSSSTPYVVDEFRDGKEFNHLAVHSHTGHVYIGAVNKLYYLTEMLGLKGTADTGPEEDSPYCPPPTQDCECLQNCDLYEKTLRPSINKVLLIDYESNRLLTCSNIFQGVCEKRRLNDITYKDETKWESVVPNDNSPVVAFIARGPRLPVPLQNQGQVMYVGAMRSSEGLDVYNDLIPSMCSRNLTTFDYAYTGFGSTKIVIDKLNRDTFKIAYVYGFSSFNFSYFTMVRGESVNNFEKKITTISRVCLDDMHFKSYAEVPLLCHHNNTNYNIMEAAYVGYPGADLARSLSLPDRPPLTENDHVLFAAFTSMENGVAEAPGTVFCVYKMRDIRSTFTRAIQSCFSGVGNTGPSYVAASTSCIVTSQLTIDDAYCGKYGMNHPVMASEALTQDAALYLPDVKVTSIITTTTTNKEYTVGFLGSENGLLHKMVIENGTYAYNYESVPIQETSADPADQKIMADMAFNRDESQLYVMTKRKVALVNVQNCGQYLTCQDCLGAQDPYCGWCSLENKCMLQKTCKDYDGHLRWLPYKGLQCTKIVQVFPKEVQIKTHQTDNTGVQLTLTVQNLPTLIQGQYECVFQSTGHPTRSTDAGLIEKPDQNRVNSTINCHTPGPNLLPSFPTGKGLWKSMVGYEVINGHVENIIIQDGKIEEKTKFDLQRPLLTDHVVMKLSLRMMDKEFVSTNVTFFDCSVHNSCTSCASSAYPCTWCVESHRCTHNREICGQEFLITGVKVPGMSDHPGPKHCPRIENDFNEILVPSGSDHRVRITAVNLQPFQTRFECVFKTLGNQRVPATLLRSNHIECNSVKFEYSQTSPAINVPFEIKWLKDNKRRSIDNPQSIQVKMYKCSRLGSNCGSCLTQEVKYECGWCGTVCSTQDNCSAGWLDHTHQCPNPLIHSVAPRLGPVQGGTRVTITGQNLGKLAEDIQNGVKVANKRCVVDIKAYIAAERIVCVTSGVAGETSGPVEVVIKNRGEAKSFIAESASHFHYMNPNIYGISPSFGPNSGGTKLTIKGRHLNAGTQISVTIRGLDCTELQIPRDGKTLVCLTPANERPDTPAHRNASIKVKFDRDEKSAPRPFEYQADPTIVEVQPERGIYSGGTQMRVVGTNINVVQDPKIVVYLANTEYRETCTIKSETAMVCLSPRFGGPNGENQHPSLNLSTDNPPQLSYGFIMDRCIGPLNRTHQYPSHVFLLFPDPYFYPFESGVKKVYELKADSDLTINGKNLNHALFEDDVSVFIGDYKCIVTSLSQNRLTCDPQDIRPEDMGSELKVMIYIGSNHSFHIGALKYEKPAIFFNIYLIGGIAGGILILIVIIVGVVVAYCRKTQENKRAAKRWQNQMDVLEARVAHECKEAFAELQTEVTELTSEVSGMSGIPFRDYRSFCMRVLFPHIPENEHPVTRPFDPSEIDAFQAQGIERGLRMFNNLILNKTFLLAFIHTLEQDMNFTVKDRVNVASLISTALQGRMDYQTDILKTLLSDLIERSTDSGNHPKLLLRRTESVAEKMLTNWFTFLLYKFLRECAGEPLYTLFRAIKQQVDKGPVDSLTSEAKYSLSEDKLIRQQIEFKQITIHVKDMQYCHEHSVRLLDCDTISQAKEKTLDTIYKNTPFSQRPDKDDVDLEWRTGVKGRVILQDEDMTTKQEGEFKRRNTLAHYGVTEGASMGLILRQTSQYNLSLGSDKSYTSQHGPHMTNGPHNGPHTRYGNGYYASSPSLSRSVSPHTINIDMDSGAKYFHLVKPHDSESHKEGERGNKMVSEIYLTRLLANKITLQQFVDDLFETIFSTANRVSALPLAIKYMFDFLDDQALQHGITDPEVVHTWKSNSLPLRFWVNLVKNPDFVFDVHKSNIVDSCLSVVAQTFMDSCSMSEHRLGKDSPSSKLLYAKDIPKYKKWVERYYQDIKQMPAISDQDMNATLSEESTLHHSEFNVNAALYELYQYVMKYNEDLMQTLEEDEFGRTYRLPFRLEQVHQAMDSEA